MRTMGQALGGAVGGWALTWASFSPAAVSAGETVSDAVADNIVLWGVGGIVVATLVGQLIMWFDPLTEARFAEIVEDIATRRDESSTDPMAAANHHKEGKAPQG